MPSTLPGLDKPIALLTDFLQDTLLRGQNNSVVLMGKHGCGKSLVLNHVLQQLRVQHNKANKFFIDITINGALQTDDTAAMK